MPVDGGPAATEPDGRERLASAARYLKLTRDLVCTVGFDGHVKWVNAAWEETLGWSETELGGRPFIEFVHPEDRDATERELGALAADPGVVEFVNRCATRDGRWIWMEWRTMAVPGEAVFYASARDITRRKAVEAALEASERRAGQVVETAPDAFVSLDADGLITGWNARAESVFGWSSTEIIGRSMAESLIPQPARDALRREIERFVATGAGRLPGQRQELMMLHRDGYEFLIEMTMSAIEGVDGYGLTAFLRDVTERRRAEAELALARDRALEASRMKSMFVANMSHEIRTPMNGVIGMTELLLDTELDDEQREYVAAISASGDALLSLIDDILDLSKVEAGKLALHVTAFDVRDAITQACAMVAGRARQKGIAFVVAVDSLPPGLVLGDGARLRQVITNLVANAVKFTARGEIVVRASSQPIGDGRASRVRIVVTDTGIGIAPGALTHLFQPFEQADSSTTRKYGGSGLGLAISRHLIELMGGVVGAESQPGRGSTFWLELPLDPAGPTDLPDDGLGMPPGGPAVAHRTRVDAVGSPARPGPLVLVVEDTPVNQAVAERMLEKRGYRSDVAENGRRALDALSGRSYAAILMDCQMPELDGFETTRQIRRLERGGRPRVPIIAMTASTMHGERERCLAAGMDDYLTKPLRSLTLQATLERWIPESAVGPGDAERPGEWTEDSGLLDEEILADLETLGEGLVASLVTLYVDDSAACLSELAAGVSVGDAPTVAQTAHRLKGASRSVGAADVGAIAEELETNARAGDLAGAEGLLAALGRSLAQTAGAFERRPAAAGPTGTART